MELTENLYRVGLENSISVKNYNKRFAYSNLYKNIEKNKKLRKRPIILLAGIRGIGKTTLMLQLFNEIEISPQIQCL